MRTLLVTLLVTAALLFGSSARANPTTARAKAAYKAGVALYRDKQYDKAYDKLLIAASLDESPAVTWMLAVCAIKRDKPLEALHHLERWEEQVPDAPPKLKARVDEARREVLPRLGRLHVHATKGSLVTVDDQPPVRSPSTRPVYVEPGTHTVQIALGDRVETRQIEVEAGAHADITGPGDAEPRTEPPPKRRAAALPPAPPPPPEREATTWPMWLGGAVAVAGLSTAVVFGGLRINAQHAVDVSRTAIERSGTSLQRCGPPAPPLELANACATLSRESRAVAQHTQVFGVALGVGLAGAALAAGWYLLTPSSGGPERRAASLVPSVGPRGASLSLEGRF